MVGFLKAEKNRAENTDVFTSGSRKAVAEIRARKPVWIRFLSPKLLPNEQLVPDDYGDFILKIQVKNPSFY